MKRGVDRQPLTQGVVGTMMAFNRAALRATIARLTKVRRMTSSTRRRPPIGMA